MDLMLMLVRTAPRLHLIFILIIIHRVSSAGWGVSYSPSRICALKDSTVIMSCNYSYPPGHQIRKVFWTRNPVEGVEPPDLSDDLKYGQRLQYLGDQQQNCTIRLSHVTLEDSHKYYFRFTTDITGRNWLGKPGVTLNITDLQLESPERVTEGDSVHLTCKSSCELTDRPTFIWSRNSQRLTSANTGNKLTLSPVRRGDAGGYRCTVDGHNLTSAEVQLSITYPPDKPVISISGSAEIVEGDSVSLICSSDSNPPAEIHWFKGGTFVGSGRIYSISKISSDDSGEYKCRSNNTHGQKYSDTVTLSIMLHSGPANAIKVASGVSFIIILIIIIALFIMRKRRGVKNEDLTVKQNDMYSVHEPLSEADSVADAPYETVNPKRLRGGQTEEIQYATVQFHRNTPMEREENEWQYDNIRVQQLQPATRVSDVQTVDGAPVIYSIVK